MATDLAGAETAGHSGGHAAGVQLMQQHGIRARAKHLFRVTAQSRPGWPTAENLLNRQFTVTAPNQGWAGASPRSIQPGWLYLAVVLDLFNRQVIGWALAEDMRQELVIDAFQRIGLRRGPDDQAGVLFHSDRDSRYAGEAFRKLLRQKRLPPVVSGKMCGDKEAVGKWKAPTAFHFPTAPTTRYIYLWNTDSKGKFKLQKYGLLSCHLAAAFG